MHNLRYYVPEKGPIFAIFAGIYYLNKWEEEAKGDGEVLFTFSAQREQNTNTSTTQSFANLKTWCVPRIFRVILESKEKKKEGERSEKKELVTRKGERKLMKVKRIQDHKRKVKEMWK